MPGFILPYGTDIYSDSSGPSKSIIWAFIKCSQ